MCIWGVGHRLYNLTTVENLRHYTVVYVTHLNIHFHKIIKVEWKTESGCQLSGE